MRVVVLLPPVDALQPLLPPAGVAHPACGLINMYE